MQWYIIKTCPMKNNQMFICIIWLCKYIDKWYLIIWFYFYHVHKNIFYKHSDLFHDLIRWKNQMNSTEVYKNRLFLVTRIGLIWFLISYYNSFMINSILPTYIIKMTNHMPSIPWYTNSVRRVRSMFQPVQLIKDKRYV